MKINHKNKRLNINKLLAFLFFILLVILLIVNINKNIAIAEGIEELQPQEIVIHTSIEKSLGIKIDNEIRELKNKITKEEITIYDIPLLKELQRYTYIICKEFDVNYELALAVMKLETGHTFDIKCVSKNYKNKKVVSLDRGLFQINSNYEAWYAELAGLKEWDVFNPYDNIRMGVAGLRHYKGLWEDKVDDVDELKIRTLNSYNMGHSGFIKYENNTGKISRAYDRRIFEYKENLTRY